MEYQFREVRVERQFGDGVLAISTGKLAKQAGGSVVVQYKDTAILAAATRAETREGTDFFPLTVDYREWTHAAGKFPGGFMKREGPPRTREVLTARLVDRPIRPLFPPGYRDEVQIMISTLSADQENEPDILAMIGASAALTISDIPFRCPTGSIRLGRIDGQLVPLPTLKQLEQSELDLVVAGTARSVLMIEGFGNQLSGQERLEAIMTAHKLLQPIVEMQLELREKLGLGERPEYESPENPLVSVLTERCYDCVREIMQIAGKRQRQNAAEELLEQLVAELVPLEGETQYSEQQVREAFYAVKQRVVRELIFEGRRPDGRGLKQIRPIHCEVGVLPRTHGSALFARGETQALVTTTLGTVSDAQKVNGIIPEYLQRFMVHYNMPPYSVGEVRPIRGPGRREIGHGALAERSLRPVVPSTDEFPYTVRVVSDILESNGSSSMASVCGGSLSLMDAGVPIKEAVAGISIGLVKEGDRYVLLTDIIGDEDHYGDMDFKAAGTKEGVTGIQLDLKIGGIEEQIIREALQQACEARLEILETMNRCIDKPRSELSPYAPKLVQVKIDPQKIGMVIGPSGKTIRQLETDTSTKIEIEEDGTITIASTDRAAAERAAEQIRELTAEVEVGKIYRGRVVSVTDFGAFVEILPGRDGLCHISELSNGYVQNVSDVCKVGDILDVKVIMIDDQDRVKLSRKAVLQERDESGEGQRPELAGAGAGGDRNLNERRERSSGQSRRNGGGRRDRRRGGGGGRTGQRRSSRR